MRLLLICGHTSARLEVPGPLRAVLLEPPYRQVHFLGHKVPLLFRTRTRDHQCAVLGAGYGIEQALPIPAVVTNLQPPRLAKPRSKTALPCLVLAIVAAGASTTAAPAAAGAVAVACLSENK
jgi:hypothetical protein